MKIAVIGCGAMGSIYAGLFALAGHEIWVVDLWRDHLNQIQKNGLRLEGASGDHVITTINTAATAGQVGCCDLYIIATKASGVAAAAKSIVTLMDSESLVLTIQNGLGAGERIAGHLPVENILLGVADGFGASMKGPGHVHHSAMNLIRLGEMGGGLTPRLDALTQLWLQAGFNAQSFEDINQLIWEKYICNSTFSAACTVFDCTLGELMSNAGLWKIALGCTDEVYRIGKASSIAFSFEDPVRYVTEFGLKMPDARPSMLLDHRCGRLSEIDAINGMAVELGKKLQIPTPYNEVLTAIVRQRELEFHSSGLIA